MNSEFSGKNYLVVGASDGIGRSVCQELGARGANLILVARQKEKLEKAIQSLPSGKHTAIPFDVTEIAAISSVIDSIMTDYKEINGCVYCPGSGDSPRLRDTTYERLHAVMRVNFYPFIEFVRCLIGWKPRAQTMRIVGISSLASTANDKYLAAYAASKAAMEAAVRCLATEIVSRNATINTIRPAFVDTGRVDHLDDIVGDVDVRIRDYQPQGYIPPEDAAKLVVYLLSDAAKFITGAAIPINGGALC
jgi:NAD(P)-dependent dehydrogenase (short-subunit alcohol dehydrogenase family)